MNQILLYYHFLLFWSILGKIDRELFFLETKVTISETSTEILRRFVFLTMFERVKSWGKFEFFSTTILDQTSNRGQILTKTVFLSKVSHILLNYALLLFWRIYEEIHREYLSLVKKVTISERSTEIFRKYGFLTMFERGKF